MLYFYFCKSETTAKYFLTSAGTACFSVTRTQLRQILLVKECFYDECLLAEKVKAIFVLQALRQNAQDTGLFVAEVSLRCRD
jgi:hypothetical protein